MRAPKCRTCGVEHWGSVCAQSEPATKTRAVAARPAEKAGETAPASAGKKLQYRGSGSAARKPVVRTVAAVVATVVVAHDDRVRDLPTASLTKISEAQAKRGRPRIHSDRKAYKAQKQREYRQRKAAEKEAGK